MVRIMARAHTVMPLGYVILTLAALTLSAGRAAAQNPIASKVVGSDIAARNRAVRQLLNPVSDQRDTEQAIEAAKRSAPSLSPRRVAKAAYRAAAVIEIGRALEKRTFQFPGVDSTIWNRPDTISLGSLPSAAALLDGLRTVPALASVVAEALQLEATRHGAQPDSVSERALQRVLRVQLNGHTNPERWYVGGQVGVKLFGEGDLGGMVRPSVRASYFVPVSPLRSWQLPVLTNLGPLTAAPDADRETQLGKLTTSSEGAYVSIEPTWDPVYLGRMQDTRVQPFVAVGAQLNRLRSTADTSTVLFGQSRVGAGVNLEVGRRASGQSVLFVSSRLVATNFSAATHERVFGSREGRRFIAENYALVPIGGSTALLIEASMARRTAPVLRVGLWSQATNGGAAASGQER